MYSYEQRRVGIELRCQYNGQMAAAAYAITGDKIVARRKVSLDGLQHRLKKLSSEI